MALKLALFVAMAVVPVIAWAKEFPVGDAKGWNLGVNYTAWAEGQKFKVGDQLVFNYTSGKHNVQKVSGIGFNTCNKTSDVKALTTGYDKINLTTAGTKWYICTFPKHCENGMKLLINVDDAEAPAPSPTGRAPSPAPSPASPAPSPAGGAPSPSGGEPSPAGGAPSPAGEAPSPDGGAGNSAAIRASFASTYLVGLAAMVAMMVVMF